ncbi:MAG: hypothetical protein CSB55_03495 [Candidatus Cloacimonadota bacterium]|nr:MAG: hypothetical protein CSB55_03495 [Candidatus Cloacimonadota bacterium]
MNTEIDLNKIIEDCKQSPVYRWSAGDTELNYSPWLCYISVTNMCNSRCRVCPREYTMRKEQGVMSFAVFKKIVDNLPSSVKKVYLFKQGEPFINKDLAKFARYLRSQLPDVFIAVHTNGALANKKRVEEVLPYIDSLGVSIGSINRETYKKIHGTDIFDRVIANLKDISELNYSLNKEKHIFIDYVFQEDNAHEPLEDAIAFFKKYRGLNSVDVHHVFNFQGEIEQGNLNIYDKLDTDKFPTCVYPWSAVTFLHDGKISYCFVEARENIFMGDINDSSFEDIWNGDEYKLFRKRMYEHDFKNLTDCGFGCKKCSWLWSMKSQSPKNLSIGYTMGKKYSVSNFDIGDLLEQNPLFILEKASYLIQIGEIHIAMGYLAALVELYEDSIRDTATELINICKNVLKRYGNIGTWKNMLNEEGYSHDEKKTLYHKI